jgi:hypothetical protein
MMQSLKEISLGHMLSETHKATTYTKYKDHSRTLGQVCDFINLFATVNQKIIEKAKAKPKSRGVSRLMLDITDCLVKMETLLRDIRVVSAKVAAQASSSKRSETVSQRVSHTLWTYYYGLGDYERSQSDTVVHPGNVLKFPAERVLPIINVEDQAKFYELLSLAERVSNKCEISHSPIPLICCLGRRRRTDCYVFFRPLFGSTRQMGLILARTFEGV